MYILSFAKMDSEFERKPRSTLRKPTKKSTKDALCCSTTARSSTASRDCGRRTTNFSADIYHAIKCYAGIFSALFAVLVQLSLVTRIDKDDLAQFMMETGMELGAVIKILACIHHRYDQATTSHVRAHIARSRVCCRKRIAFWWLSLQRKLVNFIVAAYACIYATYLLTPLITGDIFPLSGLLPNIFRELPWLVIVYPIELIMSGLRCVMITSCDCYFITLTCQLFSELQLVQQAILDHHRSRSIGCVIARHRRALEYGQMICHNYSITIVTQHCLLLILACLGALSLLYLKNKALLCNFLGLLIMAATQLLFLCLVGDKIAAESVKIGNCHDHIYAEFLDDVTSLKAILTMLTRAQRPLLLRIGEKFVIDLDLYRLTVANISSIFLVLKKFIDE